MGLILSKYICGCNENTENKIIKEEKEKEINENSNNIIKFETSYEFENSSNIEYMESFPNGNILIITNKDVQILDKNFKILKKLSKKTENVFIKNDKIFITYDNDLIDIWSYENNKINHLSQIKFNEKEKYNIKHIEIINDYDILLLNKKYIILYKANKINNNLTNNNSNYEYEYEKILIIKSQDNLYYYLITKDNKYLILFHDSYFIDFFSVKTFKKITTYKNKLSPCYYELKKIYSFGDYNIGLQYTHAPMTILEPPDIIHIINFKDINNIKKLGILQLKDYGTGVVTKENIFIIGNVLGNGRCISVYDNIVKEEYDEEKNPHKSIKLKKRYRFHHSWGSKICLLNDNKLCIYGSNEEIDIYKRNFNQNII